MIIRGQRGKRRFEKGRGKCTLIERSRWTWEKAKRGWIWNVSGGEPLPAGTGVTPSRVLPPSPSVMVPTHTNAETYTVHTHKWTNTYTQMHKCTVTYKVSQKKWLTEFGKKGFESFSFLPGDMKQRIVLKFEEIQSIQGKNTFFSYPLATSQMIKANLWLTLLVTFFWDNLY